MAAVLNPHAKEYHGGTRAFMQQPPLFSSYNLALSDISVANYFCPRFYFPNASERFVDSTPTVFSVVPNNPLATPNCWIPTQQQVPAYGQVDERTTIMIRNIPNKIQYVLELPMPFLIFRDFSVCKRVVGVFSVERLKEMLDEWCGIINQNYCGPEPFVAYDFLYLPIDFSNPCCNLGYAFVNFTHSRAVEKMYESFHGYQWRKFRSSKVCEIWFAKIQGLNALKEHFKESRFKCQRREYLPATFSPPRDGSAASLGQGRVHVLGRWNFCAGTFSSDISATAKSSYESTTTPANFVQGPRVPPKKKVWRKKRRGSDFQGHRPVKY